MRDQSERYAYIGIVLGGMTREIVGVMMILVGVSAEIATGGAFHRTRRR